MSWIKIWFFFTQYRQSQVQWHSGSIMKFLKSERWIRFFFQIYDEILILPLFPHFKKTHAQNSCALTFPAKSRLKFEKKITCTLYFPRLALNTISPDTLHGTIMRCSTSEFSFTTPMIDPLEIFWPSFRGYFFETINKLLKTNFAYRYKYLRLSI